MKRSILFLFLLLSTTAFAGDTARVLFIGNSFTAVNDLPGLTQQLAASLGDVLIPTSSAIGGALLSTHSTNANTLALIDAAQYDVVVLQEQSQAPAFPIAQVQQDVFPYAKILCDRIRSKNPCARIMFYMTWGWQNGDQQNCPNYQPLCTYVTMDSMLRLRYKIMADSNNALLCPAGGTFLRLRATQPGINLYANDGYHPSPEGTYAVACSFYSLIFSKSPVGAPYLYSLNPPTAATIQAAAKSVAFDSLSFWRQWWQPTQSVPIANFSQTIAGKTVTFSNTSQFATMHQWYFGDGGTSLVANPVHTYATAGSYNVKLISKSACGSSDTESRNITVVATAVGSDVNTPEIRLAPNPAVEYVEISGLDGRFTTIQVIDAFGKIVKNTNLVDGREQFKVSTADLTPGMYVLKLTGSDQALSLRFVRE